MNFNAKSPEAAETAATTTDGAMADRMLAALAEAGEKPVPAPQAAGQPDQKWVASWRFCPN